MPTLIKLVKPTREYTILGMIDSAPNRASTKLKSNKPINPQLMPPIMVMAKHIFCNVVIINLFSNISMGKVKIIIHKIKN